MTEMIKLTKDNFEEAIKERTRLVGGWDMDLIWFKRFF